LDAIILARKCVLPCAETVILPFYILIADETAVYPVGEMFKRNFRIHVILVEDKKTVNAER